MTPKILICADRIFGGKKALIETARAPIEKVVKDIISMIDSLLCFSLIWVTPIDLFEFRAFRMIQNETRIVKNFL